MIDTHVIITAAGSGSRFGNDIPKQFLGLGRSGIPVLMHAIEAFVNFGIPRFNIVLTLAEDSISVWEELCTQFDYNSPRIIIGGATRYESVYNAIMNIEVKQGHKILIHDGARPLVSADVIRRVLDALKSHKAVIPSLPVTDSLRRIDAASDGSAAVDRSLYRSVQTPQGFEAKTLLSAYQTGYQPTFTDDASVVEQNGTPITLVEGESRNIKITVPDDLIIAEAFLRAGK